MKLKLAALMVAAALAGAAYAQGPGYGYGPGMMGGGGYGPGYGPGMMGGGGYGPGYGPGMMRGYGYGPGPGFGGYGPRGGGLASLNLTDEQRDKIFAIQEEERAKNWGTMGQMRSEMFKLRSLYYSDKADPNALAEQQKKVDELRRQMLKSHVEARNKMLAVLTPEQKKQFRQFGPWWLEGEDE